MIASKALTTSSMSAVETGKGFPVSMVSAKAQAGRQENQPAEMSLFRAGRRSSATVSEFSSRASAEPLVPKTWMRQNIGAARTVASRPVAPLSN